jgi:hypothetical protein
MVLSPYEGRSDFLESLDPFIPLGRTVLMGGDIICICSLRYLTNAHAPHLFSGRSKLEQLMQTHELLLLFIATPFYADY